MFILGPEGFNKKHSVYNWQLFKEKLKKRKSSALLFTLVVLKRSSRDNGYVVQFFKMVCKTCKCSLVLASLFQMNELMAKIVQDIVGFSQQQHLQLLTTRLGTSLRSLS